MVACYITRTLWGVILPLLSVQNWNLQSPDYVFMCGARSAWWRWAIGALTPLLTTVAAIRCPSSQQLSRHTVLDQDSWRSKSVVAPWLKWWLFLIGLNAVPLLFRGNDQKHTDNVTEESRKQSGFRGSAALILPFVPVTTWKWEHKQRGNSESGSLRSTQPEAMKIAWFQWHTCTA